jgi:L-arabinonolactonase
VRRRIQISNGICVSPDSRYFYFADSPRRVIYRYEFEADSGCLGARTVFAHTPDGAFPDGAAIDADGCLWSALWGAGRVVRYTPGGCVDTILPIPTCQPSCVAFGGRDLSDLFVTSARDGLSKQALAQEPEAGHLFVFRTCHVGLVESRFRVAT